MIYQKTKIIAAVAAIFVLVGILGWFTHPVLTIMIGAALVTAHGYALWRRYRRAGSATLARRWKDRAERHHGVASYWSILCLSSWWTLRRSACVLKPSLRDRSWWTRWCRTPITDLGTRVIRTCRIWVMAPIEEHSLTLGGPRSGKALALDTLVPTPDGWTTMGELRDGDTVYGDDGTPCRVVHAWPVRYDRPCYEVGFSDGSTIVADAEHLWQVETRTGRKHGHAEKVLTTAEMAAHVHTGIDQRSNYSVRVAEPIQAPPAHLPIDPYLLGCWLGDGDNRCFRVTKTRDLFEVLASDGHEMGVEQTCDRSPETVTRTILDKTAALRANNLLRNKHIPSVYFRASEVQRRALLAGLLDTDGYITKAGYCVFAVTDERLALDFRSLLSTLGYKSKYSNKLAKLYGKNCGTAWQVSFTPTEQVFRLPRKANRCSEPTNRARSRISRRWVESVQPVPSVPVRCITVDSPTSLYLVGDQCIPTHNSARLAHVLTEASGAVLATSTGADLIGNTAHLRARTGPVYIFNPSGVGGLESTIGWNVLSDCESHEVATKRAADLLSATPMAGNVKNAEWVELATSALAVLMHAAALSGRRTMHSVRRWAALPDEDGTVMEVIGILRMSSEPAVALQAMAFFDAGRSRDSICLSIAPALRWLDNPGAVAATSNGTFDVEDFLATRTTLYLLAEKDGPVVPLITALAGHIARTGRRIADGRPGGRLEPPLTMVLDEAPSICTLPLPAWTSYMGKHNIAMHVGAQSLSQLGEKWGSNDAGTLLTNCASILVFGGTKDLAGLSAFTTLAGGILTPEQFQQLPKLMAVVFRNGLRPVIGRPPVVWERRDYRAAKRAAAWQSRRLAVRTLLPSRSKSVPVLAPIPGQLALPVGGTADTERAELLAEYGLVKR